MNRYLLALDPGNDTGWAAFQLEGEVLEACGVVSPNESIGRYEPEVVFIELPCVRMRSKVNPDNIISLATKVGRYQERFAGRDGRGAQIVLVKPEQWKGTLDKDVMLRRIEGALSPEETAVVGRYAGRAAIRHNMIDAIGLGKWALKQRRLDAALAAA